MGDTALITDLVRAGVDPELVGRVANALVEAAQSGNSAEFHDVSAERRRAKDRERKRKIPQNSAESAEIPMSASTLKKDTNTSSLSKRRAERISAEWKPSEVDLEFALSRGLPRPRVDTEIEKFRNYWTAKSGRDATKRDWPATWRNWILTALERLPGNPPTPPPTENLRIPPWEREGITQDAWRERELAKTNGTQVRRDSGLGKAGPH